MSRLYVVVACLLLMPLMAVAAGAAPSFGGYTGLVLTPTADALDQDEYNGAVFTRNLEEGGDETLYAANMGIQDGLEVGFARLKPEDQPGETFLNAKYRFSAETESHPGLAAGVIDLTDERGTSTYLVLSKSLLPVAYVRGQEFLTPRIHIGVGGGGQLDGFFAGLSTALGERLLLMAEYDSSNINFGARLALGDEIRVHASTLDGLDDFGVGLSFNKSM